MLLIYERPFCMLALYEEIYTSLATDFILVMADVSVSEFVSISPNLIPYILIICH